MDEGQSGVDHHENWRVNTARFFAETSCPAGPTDFRCAGFFLRRRDGASPKILVASEPPDGSISVSGARSH